MNDRTYIEEIVEEVVETRTFIEKLDEFAKLGQELKKHFRKRGRIAWELILEDAKEDYPYMEVPND